MATFLKDLKRVKRVQAAEIVEPAKRKHEASTNSSEVKEPEVKMCLDDFEIGEWFVFFSFRLAIEKLSKRAFALRCFLTKEANKHASESELRRQINAYSQLAHPNIIHNIQGHYPARHRLRLLSIR